MSDMTLEEARKLLATQDASDPARALLAVATVLRFHGISADRLLGIAETVESVATEIEADRRAALGSSTGEER